MTARLAALQLAWPATPSRSCASPGASGSSRLLLAALVDPRARSRCCRSSCSCKGLGLVNTYGGRDRAGLASIFGIFLVRQFALSIPDELLDAARLDGAGEFRIYWSIVLPLLRPILVTLAIFTFLGTWNDFLWPLVVLTDELALHAAGRAREPRRRARAGHRADDGGLGADGPAGAPRSSSLLQRYYIEGIMLGRRQGVRRREDGGRRSSRSFSSRPAPPTGLATSDAFDGPVRLARRAVRRRPARAVRRPRCSRAPRSRLDFDFRGQAGWAAARRRHRPRLSGQLGDRLRRPGRGERRTTSRSSSSTSPARTSGGRSGAISFRPRPVDTLRLKKRHFSFAWGPAGGGEIRRASAIEIAITARSGGAGWIELENLTFAPLPPSAPDAAPRQILASSARPGSILPGRSTAISRRRGGARRDGPRGSRWISESGASSAA